MKIIEIDLTNIEERGVIVDIGNDLKLDIIYNNQDENLYISILDSLENHISGHFKLVPNIDFLSLIRDAPNLQLRCIKVNEYAEERDRITPTNLNKDYKFFLIGE